MNRIAKQDTGKTNKQNHKSKMKTHRGFHAIHSTKRVDRMAHLEPIRLKNILRPPFGHAEIPNIHLEAVSTIHKNEVHSSSKHNFYEQLPI